MSVISEKLNKGNTLYKLNLNTKMLRLITYYFHKVLEE